MHEWIRVNAPLGMFSATLSVAMLLATTAIAILPDENRDSPSDKQEKQPLPSREGSPAVQSHQLGKLKSVPCKDKWATLCSVRPQHGELERQEEKGDYRFALDSVKTLIPRDNTTIKKPSCMCSVFWKDKCDCSVFNFKRRKQTPKQRRKNWLFSKINARKRKITHRRRLANPKSFPARYLNVKKHQPGRKSVLGGLQKYRRPLDRLKDLRSTLNITKPDLKTETHKLVKRSHLRNRSSKVGKTSQLYNSKLSTGQHPEVSKKDPPSFRRVPLYGQGEEQMQIWKQECGACGNLTAYEDSCFQNVTYCPWCNCRNKGLCDPETAECIADCAYGWTALDCSQNICADHRFAPYLDCSMKCESECRPWEMCHPLSGECYPMLDFPRLLCPRNTFGIGCKGKCNCYGNWLCDPETGACPEAMCKKRKHGLACFYEVAPFLDQAWVVAVIPLLIIYLFLNVFTRMYFMVVD